MNELNELETAKESKSEGLHPYRTGASTVDMPQRSEKFFSFTRIDSADSAIAM